MKSVIIVGGGPAGLLLAHFLGEHGIDYEVLERGKIAQSWRMMREGMILLSPAVPGTDWTSLTLRHPLWALPGVLPGGFSLDTPAGKKACRFLVLATGSYSEPAYPDIPGIAPNPFVIHACDFIHCMAYSGKRVLVIGGGNSAAEIAIELAGTAGVTLCTRSPMRYFSETGDLEHIRGSSESTLKECIRFKIIGLREK